MISRSPVLAERVADGVMVLGGMEKLGGRISWVPATARGFLPLNLYAVIQGADCVLVDTGLPAHEDVVLSQLAQLTPPVERMKLAITRGVEFDSMGNTTAILRSQPIEQVYSHFPSASWFQLDPRFDIEDEASRRIDSLPYAELQEGHSIPVDGSRALEVHPPALRLLQTAWLFDRSTGTLFTSDAFSYALMPSDDASRIIDEANDFVTVDDVEAGLEPKFDWLRTADPTETIDAIRTLFDTLDVRAIAPDVGCVLRGRSVVRRHVAMVMSVLEKWSDTNGE